MSSSLLLVSVSVALEGGGATPFSAAAATEEREEEGGVYRVSRLRWPPSDAKKGKD